MNEVWKTAVVDGVEHPMYKVSSFGRIICLNWGRTGKPRMCGLGKTSAGYLSLRIDGVCKLVHRIVAETFISNPEDKPCIDHINTIRTDNRVDNLRWCTYEENNNNPMTKKRLSENARKPSLGKFGAEHHRSIQIVQLTLDGQFIKKWSCAREVYRELGINHSNIASCCRGRYYKSVGGYRWMYYDDWLKLRRTKPLF